MALGRDQRVDGVGGGAAQDRADIMRVGDLIEHHDESALGQIGKVDRLQRARLQQQALMNGLARRARGDLLAGEDEGLDAARGNLRAEALGGRLGRVEADQLATRRAQRGLDAVEAIDLRDIGPRIAPSGPRAVFQAARLLILRRSCGRCAASAVMPIGCALRGLAIFLA